MIRTHNRFILLTCLCLLCTTILQAQQLTFNDVPFDWQTIRQFEHNTKSQHKTSAPDLCYQIVFEPLPGKGRYSLTSKCRLDWPREVRRGLLKDISPEQQEKLIQHQKGHIINTLVCYKILSNAVKQEPSIHKSDSVYSRISKQLKSLNDDYDFKTADGFNSLEQQAWTTFLITSLNKSYANKQGLLNDVNMISLKSDPLFKPDDPINFNYAHSRLAFSLSPGLPGIKPVLHSDTQQYNLSWSRPSKDKTGTAIDSSTDIYGVSFDKDFEILCSFSLTELEKRNYLSFGFELWSDNEPSNEMAFGISQSHIRLVYVVHDGKNSSKKEKNAYLFPKLKIDEPTLLSLRKVKERYDFFVNGKFVKTFPCIPLTGNNFSFIPLRNKVKVDFINFYYLK